MIIFFPVRYPVDKPSCRRFLKSPRNHVIFEFFFCFPFEVRYSANFYQTCRKCMSGNSSGLPISQSVRNFFKKDWKKSSKIEKSTAICPFYNFCRGRCELQLSVEDLYTFRSPFFYTTAETRIFKKIALIIEIWHFSRNLSTYTFPLPIRKNIKVHALISEDFFFFLIFFCVPGFIFLDFLSGSEGFISQLSWKFRENSSKIGTLAKVFPFFRFLTLALYII